MSGFITMVPVLFCRGVKEHHDPDGSHAGSDQLSTEQTLDETDKGSTEQALDEGSDM